MPFAAWLGDDFDLNALAMKNLNDYYLYLRARPITSTTLQSYIRGIRAFLTWCYQEEYLTIDFPAKFRLPKAQRKSIDVLTDQEIHTLFRCLSRSVAVLRLRDKSICALMLDSGLRKGEVVSLRLSSLHIPEGYVIVDGKGNKQRIVPLGLITRKTLLKYLSKRPSVPLCETLFLTDDLRPITDNTVKFIFQRLKSATLISRIRPHLLRHTFATRYLENGGNIYTLQQILGHTSLEMVKKYLHLTTSKNVKNFPDFSPLDNLL